MKTSYMVIVTHSQTRACRIVTLIVNGDKSLQRGCKRTKVYPFVRRQYSLRTTKLDKTRATNRKFIGQIPCRWCAVAVIDIVV